MSYPGFAAFATARFAARTRRKPVSEVRIFSVDWIRSGDICAVALEFLLRGPSEAGSHPRTRHGWCRSAASFRLHRFLRSSGMRFRLLPRGKSCTRNQPVPDTRCSPVSDSSSRISARRRVILIAWRTRAISSSSFCIRSAAMTGAMFFNRSAWKFLCELLCLYPCCNPADPRPDSGSSRNTGFRCPRVPSDGLPCPQRNPGNERHRFR